MHNLSSFQKLLLAASIEEKEQLNNVITALICQLDVIKHAVMQFPKVIQ